MKMLILSLLMFMSVPLLAQEAKTFTTLNGKEYSQVQITTTNKDYFTWNHNVDGNTTGGMIYYTNLNSDSFVYLFGTNMLRKYTNYLEHTRKNTELINELKKAISSDLERQNYESEKYAKMEKKLTKVSDYRVMDVSEYGARIDTDPSGENNNDHDIYVIGLTGVLSGRTYNGLLLKFVGNLTYKTVIGSYRTIPKYEITTLPPKVLVESSIPAILEKRGIQFKENGRENILKYIESLGFTTTNLPSLK